MTSLAPIKLLPENLINQIKAGEVIEKPAQMLKELLENALDAEATRIDLHLVDNGLKQLSIRDNGHGIPFSEIPWAFARHATSKLSHLNHFETLSSFGFRGEALASIASTARVRCESQTAQKDGGVFVVHGGMTQLHTPSRSSTMGTHLLIEDLFYNNPVRFNFLKSATSEKNALQKILHQFILAHPQIYFTSKWDEEERKLYPPCENIKTRLAQLIPAKEPPQWQSIHKEYEEYSLDFYYHLNARPREKKIRYIYINKRIIESVKIKKIIEQQMLPYAPQLGFVVFITTQPKYIDANVHPCKTFVKVRNQNTLFSLISGMCKSILSSNDTLEKIPRDESSREKQKDLFVNPLNKNTYASSLRPQNPLSQKTVEPLPYEGFSFLFMRQGLIVQKAQDFYYVSLSQLMHYLLKRDHQPYPLLIALEVTLSSAQQRSLQDYALEWEIINGERLRLTALPRFLFYLDYQEIFKRYQNTSRQSFFEVLLAFTQEQQKDYLPTLVTTYWDTEAWQKEKVLCPFNESLFTTP